MLNRHLLQLSGTHGLIRHLGLPDATNTGHLRAPGYAGLTTFAGTLASGNTYSFCDFPSGINVGDSTNHLTNITFVGCRFRSNNVDDANVAVYGDNITFRYCTFMPSTVSTPPTAYGQGYQYAIDLRFNGALTIDACDFWGWAEAIQFGFSSQAKPFTCLNSWLHDPRDPGTVDHTDGILESSGGTPSTMAYGVISHNRISGPGNTQAIALQGNGYYNWTITKNWCTGFGYVYSVGASGINNLTFTDNVASSELPNAFGPIYRWQAGNGNVWRRNRFYLPNAPGWTDNGIGGPAVALGDNGNFWLPDGTAAAMDYTG